MRRLVGFLSRWSAPEGSHGPLIAIAGPYWWYIAIRLRVWHKCLWIRAHGREGKRPRLDWGAGDLRGHKCECGSGRWIQNDVDGCMAPGCREHFLTAA